MFLLLLLGEILVAYHRLLSQKIESSFVMNIYLIVCELCLLLVKFFIMFLLALISQVSKLEHGSFRDILWHLIFARAITNDLDRARYLLTLLSAVIS